MMTMRTFDGPDNRAARIPTGSFPIGMKAFLDGLSPSRRPDAAHALRKLIVSCRRHGLPEALTRESAEALLADVAAEDWTRASINGLKSKLRGYARATGEGEAWARDSLQCDARPIGVVLAGRHWSRLATAAQLALQSDTPVQHLRVVDRWLRHRESISVALRPEDVIEFNPSGSTLQTLSQTLSLIDPGNPENVVVQAAARSARARPKLRNRGGKWAGLPARLRSELAEIAAKAVAARRPAPSSIDAMCSALRRLVRSARDRGLEPRLDRQTATAFAEDLLDSDLKASSGKAYMDFLERFARTAGYPAELVNEIRATMSAFRELLHSEVRRKELALAARPVELVDVARKARELLDEAPILSRADDRRLCYNLAGAMALLTKLPIRSKDLREARLGHEFRRDSEGWKFDIVTSKTGTRLAGRLASALTPYLDAVVLHDIDPAQFWRIYDQRLGTALIGNATRDWRPFGDNWLWSNMSRQIGHGPHILRTLIYDECIRDDVLDIRVASALCGHRSPASGKPYEFRADEYRRSTALAELGKIDAMLQASCG